MKELNLNFSLLRITLVSVALILATSCRDFLGSDDEEKVRAIQSEELNLDDKSSNSSEDGSILPPSGRSSGGNQSTPGDELDLNDGEKSNPSSDDDSGNNPQNKPRKAACLEDQAVNKFVIPSNPEYTYYNDRALCRFPAKNQNPSSTCFDQFDSSQVEEIELTYNAQSSLNSYPSQRLINHYISPHNKYQKGIGAPPQSGANFYTYATFNLTDYIKPGEKIECISFSYTATNKSSLITTDSATIRTSSCGGATWSDSDPRYDIWGIKHKDFIPNIIANTPVGSSYSLNLNLGDMLHSNGSRVDLVEALNQSNPKSNGKCLDFFSQDDQDYKQVIIKILKSLI